MADCIQVEAVAMMDGRTVLMLAIGVEEEELYAQLVMAGEPAPGVGVHIRLYEMKRTEVKEMGVWFIGRQGAFKQDDMLRLFMVFDVAKGLAWRLGWTPVHDLLM